MHASLGIPQVALQVPDVPTATAFFHDELGLEVLLQSPGFAVLRCGRTRLLLASGELNPSGQQTFLYFHVPDVHAAQATLSARGVRFDGEPHAVGTLAGSTIWLATFRDASGILHHLLSEVPAGQVEAVPAASPR